MGLLDSLKRFINKLFASEDPNARGKGVKESKTVTFAYIPKNLDELKALPEASLDTAFKTTALAVLILCRFKDDPEAVYGMLDYLNGPDSVSNYTKGFIKERLEGKTYLPFSYFKGATVENNYTPSEPLTITVTSTPYSFDEEPIRREASSSAKSRRQVSGLSPRSSASATSDCPWLPTRGRDAPAF